MERMTHSQNSPERYSVNWTWATIIAYREMSLLVWSQLARYSTKLYYKDWKKHHTVSYRWSKQFSCNI